MPIYEYECKKCGHLEEIMQKISDAPLTKCPECRGGLKKLISMNSFHLKGSGWYVTDYAGKNSSADTVSGSTSGDSEGSPATKDAGASSDSDSKATTSKTSKEKG